MYRQYENPYKIQKRLVDVQQELEEASINGADLDMLKELYDEVESLRERLNFAWQDDKAEVEGYE